MTTNELKERDLRDELMKIEVVNDLLRMRIALQQIESQVQILVNRKCACGGEK